MVTNLSKTVERIRSEYFKLQSIGSAAVFGARSHLYHLNEPLTVDAVEAFEKEHNITLPEEYRAYLTKFANGGGGPAYGVHPLKESFHNPWLTLGPLSESFAFTDSDMCDANYRGCLLISQRGCGGWTFLIVTGPMRGQVWYDDTIANLGFSKASDNFLNWFEYWITSSLEQTAQKPKDDGREFQERLTAIIESAPDKITKILDQEPDEDWLLAPLLRVGFACMQANQIAAALAIYKRLLRLTPPDSGEIRYEYLKGLNNAIIAACMLQDFDSAVIISDLAQPYVKENPYITHSAACAYMGVGDEKKALTQCQLAVDLNYECLDQLYNDQDLAPLHNNPEFNKIFSKH